MVAGPQQAILNRLGIEGSFLSPDAKQLASDAGRRCGGRRRKHVASRATRRVTPDDARDRVRQSTLKAASALQKERPSRRKRADSVVGYNRRASDGNKLNICRFLASPYSSITPFSVHGWHFCLSNSVT